MENGDFPMEDKPLVQAIGTRGLLGLAIFGMMGVRFLALTQPTPLLHRPHPNTMKSVSLVLLGRIPPFLNFPRDLLRCPAKPPET